MPAAIAREKQLKRWRREWKLNLIECEKPDWNGLAIDWGSNLSPPVRTTGWMRKQVQHDGLVPPALEARVL